MARKLASRERFVYVRLGDADVPWMLNHGGPKETCDGEPHRVGLQTELLDAWEKLSEDPDFYAGDLHTMEDPATHDIRDGFNALCASYSVVNFLHTEALLLHRLSPAVRDFYRTLRYDPRRKVLIGPHRIAGAADFLRSEFLAIHSTHAHTPSEISKTRALILALAGKTEIFLLVGGRASKLLAGWIASRDRDSTIIELGSAMDPLFYGRTRAAQIDPVEARAYMSDIFWSGTR